MSATTYVPYNDNLEQKQENEDAIIDSVVESMMRVNTRVFDKHRHAKRDAHAKCHGVLVGHVTVYDNLAPHLAQGVFARPGTYPVVIRLSTAPGDIHSDKLPSPRGMAIKMLGVDGPQFLPNRQDATTQDLLLVNHPVIAFGHAAAYLKTQKLLEKHADDPDMVRRIVAALARGGSKALHALGIENPVVDTLGAPNNHILGETFFSMAAVRYGDYVAKLCAAPLSSNVRALTGQPLGDDADDSALRNLVVDFFSGQGAEYELRAQLCTDIATMPIEDASIEWSQEDSPYQPVARLTIPPQQAFSPARRVFADDVLSFNPWHCIEAHRPLGSIMRARIKAYEASSKFRHEMNAQPRIEIDSIGQVPD
ncbi:catalase family protein [Massilia scottii]|uniref:catalase family protein n=1 Tax=Massilia scottii TaxID=3057166 RepID=UPI00279647F9|nr:catalase family protein [Massilia sp. CCM 9029]MDQ1830271.1 catalase family protein [Massilia sp. CCM 9029]